MKLRNDRLLVRLILEKYTKAGIAIPESAKHPSFIKAEIVKVGEWVRMPDGAIVPMKEELPVGAKVLIGKHAGNDIKVEYKLPEEEKPSMHIMRIINQGEVLVFLEEGDITDV